MDFTKVREAIINTHINKYIFSHCVLYDLKFLPELTTVILNLLSDDMIKELIIAKQDNRIAFGCYYMMAANIKKGEPFGFGEDTYLGQLATEILTFLNQNMNVIMTGEYELMEEFKNDLIKKYEMDKLIKAFDDIPINQMSELIQNITTIVSNMPADFLMYIKKFLKTDEKYLQHLIILK